MGENAQNYESLQPTNMTGYFGYPITCNGTLVAVNATGFCILTERAQQYVALVLISYREVNGIPLPTYHIKQAYCDFANNNSVSGLDYSFGSVSYNNLNIPVTSDELLGIELLATCTAVRCNFQPAIINVTSKHKLYFLEYGDAVTENNLKLISNASLLFSATIVSESSDTIVSESSDTIISNSSDTNDKEGIYTADNVQDKITVPLYLSIFSIDFTTALYQQQVHCRVV